MGDFGIILGLEYAKNRYFLQKKFHLMAAVANILTIIIPV